ncbi:hypothetical protein DSECCO2_380730 [anaerobic digester metagenome]
MIHQVGDTKGHPEVVFISVILGEIFQSFGSDSEAPVLVNILDAGVEVMTAEFSLQIEVLYWRQFGRCKHAIEDTGASCLTGEAVSTQTEVEHPRNSEHNGLLGGNGVG